MYTYIHMYILSVYVCMIYLNVYMHGGGICVCIHMCMYIYIDTCVWVGRMADVGACVLSV